MITKVILKNWRSHLDSEFKFSDGTNCFIGPMGSGKTSVLDAICFAFFGTFPSLNQKKLKLEDVIMKKPKPKDMAEVDVFFELDGNEWSIKRTISKGRSTAELRKNGELIEGPQTSRVTEEVEKLLKIDYDLFTRAIYSEQNQLDHFLTIPKGQRMKKIDELLAIDKFEKARANSRTLTNKILSYIEEKRRLLDTLSKDETIKRYEFIKNEISELKQKELTYKKQIREVQAKKKILEENLSVLKVQKQKLEELESTNQMLTGQINILENDLEKLKESLMEFSEKTKEDLQIELKILSENLEKLKNSAQSDEATLSSLKDKISENKARSNFIEKQRMPELRMLIKEKSKIFAKIKDESPDLLKSDIAGKEKELEKIKNNIQANLTRIEDIKASMQNLKQTGDVCPICNNKLTKKKKSEILAERRKHISKLKSENIKLERNEKVLKSIIEKLEEKLNLVESFKDKLELVESDKRELARLDAELKDLKDEGTLLENHKRMIEKNLDILFRNIEEIQDKQIKLKEILFKREEADSKLEKLREYRNKLTEINVEKSKYAMFSQTTLDIVEADYRNSLVLERGLEANIEHIENMYIERQKLLQEIEDKKQSLETIKQEIKKVEALAEQFKLLELCLLDTQDKLRKDFVLAVNEAMQSIWGSLYPYRDIYSVKLSIEEGDYVLQLQDSTGWLPADGVASGGERSMACLALRIAFAMVLAPQLKWLVLDEPTHNLDSRAIEVLAETLRDRASNLVDQIFLITHDSALESAVSGYLYRLDREKEKDGYTKVTPLSGPEM